MIKHSLLYLSGLTVAFALLFHFSNPETSAPEGRKVELEGKYSSGLEFSVLIPCNSKDYYWVSGDTNIVDVIVERSHQPIFVKLQGTLTGPGGYGYRGYYKYEFKIEKLIRATDTFPKHCRFETIT